MQTRPLHCQSVMSGLREQEHVFCLLMDALDASLHLRAQLDQALKAGYLNIAKARYAMGPSSISQANYGSAMKAATYLQKTEIKLTGQPFNIACLLGKVVQTRCEVSTMQHGPMNATDAQKLPGPDLSSTGSTPTRQQSAVEDENDMQHDQPSTTQDRSRLQNGAAPSEYSSNAIADLAAKFDSHHMDDAKSAQQCNAVTDPLRWFGYMVSPYLRQAQSCFVQAAEAAVQLASAQHQVITAMSELQQLRKIRTSTEE